MRLTSVDLEAALVDVAGAFGVRWAMVLDEDDEVLASAGPAAGEVPPGSPVHPSLADARAVLEAVPEPAGTVWRAPHLGGESEVYLERLGALWLFGVAFDPSLTSLGAIRLKAVPARARIERLLLSQ